MKKIIAFCLGSFFYLNFSYAQNQTIKEYLDAYVGENAQPYLQPLADLFASNINTNVWECSQTDTKLYVRLKVQAMASFPSESMKTFMGKTTGGFTPPQTLEVPTIIGDKDLTILQGDSNSVFVFPGGYELRRMILGTPQLTIGGFLHSEVSGRFLSFSLDDDYGRVRFIGLGVRHFITGYFENPPIDISIGYFYHHIQAGTYLDSDQHLLSASLGKSGKILSGQIMVGYQTSNSAIHYVYEDGEDSFDVDVYLDNKNPWIVEASAGLKLGPVFATGAVSYAKHATLALGAGLFF
jgi:hypothetical protein